MILVYVLAKFFLYCAMCHVLTRAFRLSVPEWDFSVTWGSARFVIGLLFGIPIAVAYGYADKAGASETVSYAVAFG
jgi:hypothetical protein